VYGRQGLCPRHVQQYEGCGPTRGRIYYGRWRRYSREYLRSNGTCVRCGKAATDVDHKIPHRDDEQKFWDPTNHQALCHSCHSVKTAAEDGGFGNA
jgi:5-methylcytosine-specific restriction enzyme A